MKGEYYIFCSECGTKAFNTDAQLDEEGQWVCCGLLEDNRAYYKRTPQSSIRTPPLVYHPSRVPRFGNASGTYWETTFLKWETINTNWEDI